MDHVHEVVKGIKQCVRYCFPDAAMLHFATAGAILGLKTMNMNMIVLHKIKDAEMLLEKRSSIYSDRPILPIVKL